ncbi:alpha-1,2-fucosyltransferase [Cohnella caldifontis]|uniref:alpha-1,2-fucosyltransferase n=1 Tax=Cohnella caldifontis TaxID=3027471 RepID=UPI0023EB36CC|nr:alpha-1,2-fucosyltransferase [Cohnella sp. YIM B05605]
MIIVKVLGGLGNQMFQYAFYRSLKERNYVAKIDVQSFNNYKLHNGFELNNIFRNIEAEYASKKDVNRLAGNPIRRRIFGFKRTYYRETTLRFNSDIQHSDVDNTYFQGYWQSEKYFSNIESIIRREFEFPPFDEVENIRLEPLIRLQNSVSIHVRRGDYVNHPLYSNICTEQYYSRAIEYIMNHVNTPYFYVFSDDIVWCRKNLDLSTQVEYIDWNNGQRSYRDMQLMSFCKHHIIANSTFSWWGAWLNPNPDKIVIAPKRFMNGENDAIDLVPDRWLRL